jgi:hypothetical protein
VNIVNKDLLQNLTITIETNQPIQSATLQTMKRADPGCHDWSQDSGRWGKQGRQLSSGKPRHVVSRRQQDDLLPCDVERRAHQH